MAASMHDFDELNAFCAVMASGSLTRSARELGLAKSTLSRRISQLEARLGQPLRREVSGELAIEVHSALARGWLGPLMDDFMARYPQVALTLQTGKALPDPPDSHRVHIWLGDVPDSGLRQEALGALGRGLYAHHDYLTRQGAPEHP
ncbi:LysR family transcriptional regulator, partial [Halomonas sp. BM-2019]|uniref:LysR family transcriptional regulator n=1 Tax=Halomonas sp. BM-2019 TaxID=2811227 RepID=UPI0031FE0715